MNEILERIDRIITDCSKRDLIPSAEVVNDLLDLRNEVVETADNLNPIPA